MHDGGFAHRVLSPACLQLSARQGMNKNVAIEDCDPTMLLLKLNEFGRTVALDDAPLSTPGGGLGEQFGKVTEGRILGAHRGRRSCGPWPSSMAQCC